MVMRCEIFRGQTTYNMGNVKMVNDSLFLLNPNHSMFTNAASRVSPFLPRPAPSLPPSSRGTAKGGRKRNDSGNREIKSHAYAKRQTWNCTTWPGFYLLIFRLMSTWIWRLLSVVNVTLNLFNEVENTATPRSARKREVELQSKTNFRFYLFFVVFFKNKTVENEIVNYPTTSINCIEKRLTENSFSLFTSPLCTALENWNLFTLFTS